MHGEELTTHDFEGHIARFGSESTPQWEPDTRRARPGAPNVIVLLMDDMGYSDISPFGSEIQTPNLEELAQAGYRMSNYHTPPMCAPARASLLTGVNNHRAGFSYVPHMDPGYPHSRMHLAQDMATLPESFRAAGYATMMVGKWHLTPEHLMHDAADKSSWPLQRGFDRYYGCMDGFTSLMHPHRLVNDNSQVVIDQYPEDFYLTDELTDKAIDMIDEVKNADPAKPFLLYFAHQAMHGPLQAKQSDIAKHRGNYEQGWDAIRAQRFARQQQSGLLPPQARCAPRNEGPQTEVKPWEDYDLATRTRMARLMEVYAGMVSNMDDNLGKLINHLKETGEYENTIIVFTSDNGGTAEGGAEGTRSYFSQFTSIRPERWDPDVDRELELLGGPQVMSHYPRGWAYASNTPFRMYKMHQLAGGIRVPLIISWPAGLPRSTDDHGLRHQFLHVTDIAPTLAELAEVPWLTRRQGLPTQALDGCSAVPFLRDSAAPATHKSQYFELSGRRAYVEGRYKIVTLEPGAPGMRDEAWQLYDLSSDPTELNDLAAEHPQIVSAMAEAWEREAWANNVFPIDDKAEFSRILPEHQQWMSDPVTLRAFAPTLERVRSSHLVLMRDVHIIARLGSGELGQGVILAHGDQGGGYVLFIEDGLTKLSYNAYGKMHYLSAAVPSAQTLSLRFSCRSEARWSIELLADDQLVGSLDDVPMLLGMCPFTGISVGLDRGGPVDWELSQRHGSFRYTGPLEHVQYIPGQRSAESPAILQRLEKQNIIAD